MKIKMKSGREFECDYVATIPNPQQAFIRVFAPLATVAAVFSDRNETEQMWYGDTYLGQYTKIVVIIPEGDAIKVCLEKE